MSWRKAQLQDLVFFQRGFDITKAEQHDGPYPVISSSGTSSYHNKFMATGPGVIIGRKGSLGTVHYAHENYWPHDTTLWSKDFRGNDPRYVYYFIHTLDLANFDVGGANPTLNRNHIHILDVSIPSLPVQIRIASILSTYDDLLAANQRRIQLLEESARLLYREWFVKLRFPGHEIVPVTDGVPEDWARMPVSDMVDSNPKTPFPKDVVRPFVGMEALSTDSMIVDVSESRQIAGGAKFRNGDTLLARITPCLENGKTGFVQFLEDGTAAASGSTEFIVLRSRTVNPYWVYCLARSESFREHAIRSMAGSDGRQRVNAKSFDQYFTLQPPQDVLQQFEDSVSEMFAQIQSLTEYNRSLQEARDLLLPKLMSGALDVSRISVSGELA